ncbi:MAG: CPXCG motif-containing cysteine-rich protein [Pseudomonadota bacterium]
MFEVEEVFLYCPYCGEPISVLLDGATVEQLGAGDMSYIEDCQVCCRPMVLLPQLEGDGSLSLTARQENDC